MGQVTIDGAITGGPPQGGTGFPGAVFNARLSLSQNPKSYTVATGILLMSVNSAGAFVAVPGVGTTVTKADTLYLRCDDALEVRTTTDDGAGGDVVSVSVLQGLMVQEFPTLKFLKLLEVKGVASLEFFASGPE